MLIFTTVSVGKGAVCQDRAYFGLDGESAGGKGQQVTLGYLQEYYTYIMPHVDPLRYGLI
jgi:hypothetical protein